jgi:hypothetical protein
MAFSKDLAIIAVGFNTGRLRIYSWPLINEISGYNFSYDITVDNTSITEVIFTVC